MTHLTRKMRLETIGRPLLMAVILVGGCRADFHPSEDSTTTGGSGAGTTGNGETSGDGDTGSGGGTSTGGGAGTGGPTSTGDGATGSSGSSSTDGTETSGTATGTNTGTTGSVCGDGVIDDDEMCDGGPGCTDCVLDNYACNPINNVPCQDGTKCSAVGEEYDVMCLPFDPDPPLEWGEVNCYYDFGPHDEACDLGLACTPSQITDTCENGTGSCCTEFCDIRDPDFECQTPTDSCEPFWFGSPPDGLEWLGFCSQP
jgi:hypothetical protein